ncbi:MAG: methionine--tRNA ligase [Candidatus Tectomicrobia bacterium]|nr:methionine--tRNA ligase [Candidatus Tectomicrobia bacterium]
MAGTYYITTPIYYVNDAPHIGHAYTTIAADCLARFRRLAGDEVFFLTGTDEHGQKVERAAREQGLAPLALADRVVGRYRQLWERLNIRPDDFIRTTEARHREGVEALFHRVQERGDIYLGEYEGWYCTPDESFWTETQLVDGRCPECGRPVERVREESYFFRMSKYQEPLLRHLEEHPGFILPESRRNEIIRFVQGGLRDLSISRTSFAWGIPVPGGEGHVLYVWFDALANYLSALGFGQRGGEARCEKFWPASVHLIGKDILRFHAVYWPAFLLSAGLPLPRCIFAHGWWTVEGKKMSKSLRNVVEPNRLLDQYGPDAVRYFVLREVPFGQDGDFSHQALIDRINSDLANDLGNLLHRTVGMIGRFCGGRAPRAAQTGDLERGVQGAARRTTEALWDDLETAGFQSALKRIWDFINGVNKYLDERAPWSSAKRGDEPGVATTLYTAAEALRTVSVWLWPFMPETALKIRSRLGLGEEDAPRFLEEARSWGLLPPGGAVHPGPPLFPRIEAEEAAGIKLAVSREVAGEAGAAQEKGGRRPEGAEAGAPAPGRREAPQGVALIGDEVFSKVSLRAARVISAEKVERSKNLLRLRVDLGEEQRTVVAGIAGSYAPEALAGKTVVLVANLKPRKLMGVESQGMVLAAEEGSGYALVTLDKPVPPGTRIH